MQLSTAIEEK